MEQILLLPETITPEARTTTDALTLGLEEELILVDPHTLEPVDGIEAVLDRLVDPSVQPEFRAAQVELVTPVCAGVGELMREVASGRARLVAALDRSVRLLAAGTHPTTRGPSAITDRPRYRGIARDHGWALRRGLPSGLHVHVGIADPDELLDVYNAARGYLPLLAALAANSPFFEGTDSALASSRLKLVEDLPRAATPPVFATHAEFAAFVAWGVAGGLFHDLTYLWWDVRPRPDLGTIEFRVADAQTRVEDTAAVAALVQSLVAALRLRLRAGERLDVQPTQVIQENRWRAVRDGLDAELVDPHTGIPRPARDRLARLVLELEPYADELGCDAELALVWPLLARNGASRQRELAGKHGLEGLLQRLVADTESQ